VAHVVAPLVAIAAVVATYLASASMLDRPIRSIEISGPFQRVTALQIEEAISDEMTDGFVSADLAVIQRRIVELPWIDQAMVARRWPSRIRISVTEQVPAAIWGERGLLNVRGELFVSNARHIPAELPRLSGPGNRSAEVATRYLEVRDRLIPVGLDLRSVHLDPRGAWQMTLLNGVNVRLGRRDIDERTDLFLDIVADIITGRAAEIEYVDMRYSNGFTIGWNNGSRSPVTDPEEGVDKMLASRGTR
jgi:cell division protein FtsQ